MLSCVVYGCENNTLTNPDPEIIYHSFPKHAEVAEKWIVATGWDRQQIDVANGQICSAHFAPDCYNTEYKMIDFIQCYTKTLKYDAVPTLLLPAKAEVIIKHPIIQQLGNTTDQSEIKSMIVYLPTTSQTTYVAQQATSSRNYLPLTTDQPTAKTSGETHTQQVTEIVSEKYSKVQTAEQLSKLKDANAELMAKIHRLEVSTRELEALAAKKATEYAEKTANLRDLRQIYLTMKQKPLILKHQKALLSKVFSSSQVKILSGKKKIYWSDDDMAVSYTIRHLSNKRCFEYVTKNMKIPLPALSSVKRWINSKLRYKGAKNKEKKDDVSKMETENEDDALVKSE